MTCASPTPEQSWRSTSEDRIWDDSTRRNLPAFIVCADPQTLLRNLAPDVSSPAQHDLPLYRSSRHFVPSTLSPSPPTTPSPIAPLLHCPPFTGHRSTVYRPPSTPPPPPEYPLTCRWMGLLAALSSGSRSCLGGLPAASRPKSSRCSGQNKPGWADTSTSTGRTR